MKTKIFTLALALAAATTANAIPAQRGIWRTMKLANGTEIKVELRGDEFMHYWQDAEGNRYTVNADNYLQVADMNQLLKRSVEMRTAAANVSDGAMRVKKAPGSKKSAYKGDKRCLILLVEFSDKKFSMSDPLAFYKRVANEKGFSEGKFKGSVSDYFSAQSNGQFNIDFDVVGPYQLANVSSYGENVTDDNGNRLYDKNAAGIITGACQAAARAGVDFSPYDWDNDGTVEMVYVIYAGEGEATGGGEETIWPHKSQLYPSKTYGGKRVSVYACSNELSSKTAVAGIGTICHEFSHCLGYPDAYDVDYNGFYGMGSWDLMCQGSYNGNQFVPAGYTAYEKWVAGWIEPVVLHDNASFSDIKPVADGGDAYMFYNPGNKNEYYILENRQRAGWDAQLPASGILVNHITYDQSIWDQNIPNTNRPPQNTFERMTIIPADGMRSTSNEAGDPWGNSIAKATLSNSTTPATSTNTANVDGSKYMNIAFTNMKMTDGLASFTFTNYNLGSSQEGYVIHETFDKCQGTGGNDGRFAPKSLEKNFAMGNFLADVDGWDGTFMKGANQCARIGMTSDTQAKLTTPTLKLNGEAKFIFKAAPYSTDGEKLVLSASDGVTLGETEFTMKKGEWTEYSTTVKGNGEFTITFQGEKRWFLDEVIIQENGASGIEGIHTTTNAKRDSRVFSIDGRFLGNDINAMGKGLYIVGGKKVIK